MQNEIITNQYFRRLLSAAAKIVWLLKQYTKGHFSELKTTTTTKILQWHSTLAVPFSAILSAQQHWPLVSVSIWSPCWERLWSIYGKLNMSLSLKLVFSLAALNLMHITFLLPEYWYHFYSTGLWIFFLKELYSLPEFL